MESDLADLLRDLLFNRRMLLMRKLYIFDTTLRDGEQSLGITLNVKEKLAIGRQLVNWAWTLLKRVSGLITGDFESVKTIAKELKGVTICGLTERCKGHRCLRRSPERSERPAFTPASRCLRFIWPKSSTKPRRK